MTQISIIVPVYNKSEYLRTMLDSVLNQSFSDFEIILIDDGSTDGSERIADEYQQKDSRVKVKHIKNEGVSHARNVGLDVAKGEYITFIDSDDTVAEDYLLNMYRLAEENSVPIVICGIIKLWPDQFDKEVILPPYRGRKEMRDIINEFASVQKQTGIYGFCAAKIVSRELIGSNRFDEKVVLAEDFDFYLKLYRQIHSIYFTDYAGYYYVQNTDNSPMKVQDDKIDYYSQLLIQQRFAKFLKEMNAYSENNKSIIEKSIQNYMYLTIHYAPRESFDEIFQDVHNVYIETGIPLIGNNIRQKIVFVLLKSHCTQMAKMAVMGFRSLKRIIRR